MWPGFRVFAGGLVIWAWLLLLCPSAGAGTITVDLAREQGPVTHRANGYLVSIQPDQPATELILPLKPTSFRGSAGYVFANHDRLKQIGVTEFQLTLGLVFGDPTQWIFDINRIGEGDRYEPWVAHVNRIIDEVLARKLSVMWDIYNEPDLATLPINENDKLKEGWRLAYRLIKQRVPDALIVGPSVSRYRFVKPFLDWSQRQDVFPDVVAYHEYDDPAGVQMLVGDLRRYLEEHRRSVPISVNEIIGQETWTQAGYVAAVLAAYERADILSAMHACWPDPHDTSRDGVENTCDNPTLDGLLYIDRTSKRPTWHIYEFYAAMQGAKIETVTDRAELHALAAYERASGTLRILAGKYEDGDSTETRVVVRNWPRSGPFPRGDALSVCAELVPDVGSGPLDRTIRTLSTSVAPDGEDFSFVLPEFRRADAYRVTVGPGTACK